ncbi:MAG: hypothetical protein RPT25_02960 [Cycloclasticus sp.]|jgi:Taurine catabolism dioxygenase TauD, TfdA family.
MRDSELSLELELKRKGYVSFSSNPEKSILEVASDFGEVYKVPTMPLVQTLTPRFRENEQENTYSGNYGLNEFPFHTDLAHWYVPPRYLFLRCEFPAVDVATKLIDCQDIMNDEVIDLLARAHFRPRKRLDGKSNILKIFNENIFRWDSIFIKPANKIGERLKICIVELLHSIQSQEVFLTSKGDCLLIDNWRMLHGRGCIDSNSMNRKIERVYFNEVKF